jgi:hypothetical protein
MRQLARIEATMNERLDFRAVGCEKKERPVSRSLSTVPYLPPLHGGMAYKHHNPTTTNVRLCEPL